MANNRVYIVCKKCRKEGKEPNCFFLGKYYPKHGWYATGEKDMRTDINTNFFDIHNHQGSLFGYDEGEVPFELEFEAGQRAQDQILIALSQAVSSANKE